MKAALATALRESCGYLRDEGWHQTGQLMTLAADEIDRLNARVRELETARGIAPGIEGLQTPDASNQNVARVAAAARR
ncbi:MAG TPA: hypothetical protein VD867_18075 [Burkholderiales bacterium]|jgi:hypothetical protein|nr:hypothetical protein [Burkholderiales bacterium]